MTLLLRVWSGGMFLGALACGAPNVVVLSPDLTAARSDGLRPVVSYDALPQCDIPPRPEVPLRRREVAGLPVRLALPAEFAADRTRSSSLGEQHSWSARRGGRWVVVAHGGQALVDGSMPRAMYILSEELVDSTGTLIIANCHHCYEVTYRCQATVNGLPVLMGLSDRPGYHDAFAVWHLGPDRWLVVAVGSPDSVRTATIRTLLWQVEVR